MICLLSLYCLSSWTCQTLNSYLRSFLMKTSLLSFPTLQLGSARAFQRIQLLPVQTPLQPFPLLRFSSLLILLPAYIHRWQWPSIVPAFDASANGLPIPSRRPQRRAVVLLAAADLVHADTLPLQINERVIELLVEGFVIHFDFFLTGYFVHDQGAFKRFFATGLASSSKNFVASVLRIL